MKKITLTVICIFALSACTTNRQVWMTTVNSGSFNLTVSQVISKNEALVANGDEYIKLKKCDKILKENPLYEGFNFNLRRYQSVRNGTYSYITTMGAKRVIAAYDITCDIERPDIYEMSIQNSFCRPTGELTQTDGGYSANGCATPEQVENVIARDKCKIQDNGTYLCKK